MCPHDKIVIKDFSTYSKALKIAICSTCLEVQKVIIQGEKPVIKQETEKEMWANKDKRIARMSALKTAGELAISQGIGGTDLVKLTLKTADTLMEWIYLE